MFLSLFPNEAKEPKMLPTNLPLTALEKLVQDHSRLTESESDEHTPLEMLIGYYEGGEYGCMPIENPESDETDPLKRLHEGERLAIQLHLGMIQYESTFIDGAPYVATENEIEANDDLIDDPGMFPDETGFFGLGVWLDGSRLGIEPVTISGDMNGNVCVTKATFPRSLIERAAKYVRKVEAGSSPPSA